MFQNQDNQNDLDNNTEQQSTSGYIGSGLVDKLFGAVQWTQETVHALGEKIGVLTEDTDQTLGFKDDIQEINTNLDSDELKDEVNWSNISLKSNPKVHVPIRIHEPVQDMLFSTEAFKHEVEETASDMHPNMKALYQFDRKYDVGASIHSVNAVHARNVNTLEGATGAVLVNSTHTPGYHVTSINVKPIDKQDFKTELERGAAEMHASNIIETKKEGLNSVIDAGAEKIKKGVENATQITIDVALKAQDNVNWTKDKGQQNVDLIKEKAQYALDLAKEKARQNYVWTMAKTEEGKEKLMEAVRKTPETVMETLQEGTTMIGEKIGLLEPVPKDFDQAIQLGAAQMYPDMNTLHQFDEKYQLDAEIDTVNTINFDTAIERGAQKMKTTHNIESAKEGAFSIIDTGADKIKNAIQYVAESTKAAAFKAHDKANETSDRTRLNVDLAKDQANRNVNLMKEFAKENFEWAKAKTFEGKEKFVEAVHKTQELMHGFGEQMTTLPEQSSEGEIDFNEAIAEGAADMKSSLDMDHLRQLDAKYELDANISTVHRPDFDTDISRGAAKMHATHNIESAKEGILNAIDSGATILKQGVELVADNTKSVTRNAQENAYSTQDAVQRNIENTKDKVIEGKENLVDAASKATDNIRFGVRTNKST